MASGVSSSVRSHIFRPYRSFGAIVITKTTTSAYDAAKHMTDNAPIIYAEVHGSLPGFARVRFTSTRCELLKELLLTTAVRDMGNTKFVFSMITAMLFP